MTEKVSPQDDIKEARALYTVTLSAAKGLDRPGCKQNERLELLMKPPHYCVRSFGLRPQDDIKGARAPYTVTLSEAKGLDRPCTEQNDRPGFTARDLNQSVRSFGLRPQDDRKRRPSG